MIFASDILSGRASATGTRTTFLADMKRALALRLAYNRTVRELSALNDSALTDLGMTRSQISAVAHKAIYGTAA